MYGAPGVLDTGDENVVPDGFVDVVSSYLKPWAAPFLEDNVGLMAAQNLLFGIDSFGQKIPDEDRIFGRRGLTGLLGPSAHAQIRKISQASREDVDRRGRAIDETGVISQQLGLGMKEQSVDELMRRLENLRIQMATVRKDLKRAIIRANKNKQLSEAERDQEKADAREEYKSLRDRIRERMEQVERALEARRDRE